MAGFKRTWESLSNYQQQVMLALLRGTIVYAIWNDGARDCDQRQLERLGYTKVGRVNDIVGDHLRLTVEGWALVATAVAEGESDEDQDTTEVA